LTGLAARGVLLLQFGRSVEWATNTWGINLPPSNNNFPQHSWLPEFRTNLLRLISQLIVNHGDDHYDTDRKTAELLPLFKSAIPFIDAGILRTIFEVEYYLLYVASVSYNL